MASPLRPLVIAIVIGFPIGPILRLSTAQELLSPSSHREEINRVIATIEWPLRPVVAIREPEAEAEEFRQKIRQLQSLLKDLSAYETAEIRQAMLEAMSRSSNRGDSKYHLIIRYLFDIPESTRFDSPHARFLRSGMPQGVPCDRETFSSAWPWKVVDRRVEFDQDHEIVILICMGPRIDILEVFDYCQNNFGRRTINPSK